MCNAESEMGGWVGKRVCGRDAVRLVTVVRVASRCTMIAPERQTRDFASCACDVSANAWLGKQELFVASQIASGLVDKFKPQRHPS